MGGRGSSSGGGFGGGASISARQFQQVQGQQMQDTQLQPTQTMATAANNINFSDTDDSDYHDMYNGRQYFNSQNMTIDSQIAAINYLHPDTLPGSLYNPAQDLNRAMVQGKKLNANQQYMLDGLMGAMHNLGYNVNLTRYDHDGMVNSLIKAAGGSGSYENYTEAQLKSMLVGTRYGENKLVSTSYNNFKNTPAQSKSVFDTRAVRIKYKAKAGVQAMMPGDGYIKNGNSYIKNPLGEVLLAPSGKSQNYKILDVRLTNEVARRQGTQLFNQKRIELIVEVDPQS